MSGEIISFKTGSGQVEVNPKAKIASDNLGHWSVKPETTHLPKINPEPSNSELPSTSKQEKTDEINVQKKNVELTKKVNSVYQRAQKITAMVDYFTKKRPFALRDFMKSGKFSIREKLNLFQNSSQAALVNDEDLVDEAELLLSQNLGGNNSITYDLDRLLFSFELAKIFHIRPEIIERFDQQIVESINRFLDTDLVGIKMMVSGKFSLLEKMPERYRAIIFDRLYDKLKADGDENKQVELLAKAPLLGEGVKVYQIEASKLFNTYIERTIETSRQPFDFNKPLDQDNKKVKSINDFALLIDTGALKCDEELFGKLIEFNREVGVKTYRLSVVFNSFMQHLNQDSRERMVAKYENYVNDLPIFARFKMLEGLKGEAMIDRFMIALNSKVDIYGQESDQVMQDLDEAVKLANKHTEEQSVLNDLILGKIYHYLGNSMNSRILDNYKDLGLLYRNANEDLKKMIDPILKEFAEFINKEIMILNSEEVDKKNRYFSLADLRVAIFDNYVNFNDEYKEIFADEATHFIINGKVFSNVYNSVQDEETIFALPKENREAVIRELLGRTKGVRDESSIRLSINLRIANKSLALEYDRILRQEFPEYLEYLLELEPTSPLHKSASVDKVVKFDKDGSETYILPADKEMSVRIINSFALESWYKAIVSHEEWTKLGFNYVPIEPIVDIDHVQGNDLMAAVTTLNLRGPSLANAAVNYPRAIQYKLYELRNKIIHGLANLGIHHGHPHNNNFVLIPELLENGKINYEKIPRIYLIDFDMAQSTK